MDSSGSDDKLSVLNSRNPIFTDSWRNMMERTKGAVRPKPSKETLVYRKPRTTSEMDVDGLSKPSSSSSTTSFTSDFWTFESSSSSVENSSDGMQESRRRLRRTEKRRTDLFCHVCYEAEVKVCEHLGDPVPLPFSDGPWLGHAATGAYGYTCPLLFFQKRLQQFYHKLDYSGKC